MIAQSSIEKLLEENQKIEEAILSFEDEVSFDFFSAWRAKQQQVGERLADIAISLTAKEFDAYILANPVNPSSFAHFIRPDVQSKSFHIRARTIRSGIRSGFLESHPSQFQTRPLVFCVGGETYDSVQRANVESLVRKKESSDISLIVSCYENGSYIVSDIDLISIYLRENSDETLSDPIYGELTAQELAVVQELNRNFLQVTAKYYPLQSQSSFRLIAHGPANRFTHSKASHLHYPMKIYAPSSSIERLEDSHANFLEFHRVMLTQAYHGYLNSKWEF